MRYKIFFNKQWFILLHAFTIWLKNSAKFHSENDDYSFLCSFSVVPKKHILKNLTDVIEKCRKYNLKLHPEKCSFFMHEGTFLLR